jgi:signal transduction histidine kinase/response regulator RpfG family c-di-GMP phosphodiesterase
MRIRDNKIGNQLRMGFGLILLLVAVLVAVAWLQTDRIQDEVSTMYRHPLMVRRALGELTEKILLMHRGMKDLVVAEDATQMAMMIHEIEIERTRALEQFDVLNDRYLGPRSDIEATFVAFTEWDAIRAKTIEILKAGNTDLAFLRTLRDGEGGRKVVELLTFIGRIDDFARKKADSLYENALRVNQQLKAQLLGVSTAIFVLISIIGYFLLGSIKRPLEILTAATSQFKEGNIEARSDYTYKNEFGKLSDSFNAMADEVQGMLVLNEKATTLSDAMLKENDAHSFCKKLLTLLIEFSGSQQGAVYLLDETKGEFAHFECIGMSAEGCRTFSAIELEGEFGLCRASACIKHLKDIPADSRFSFVTVTGSFKPREIITIPILRDAETVAIISLATIYTYDELVLQLLHRVSDTLNARMDGILSYRRILEVTKQLGLQNKELEAQKRELSAQAGELTEQNVELEMQKKQLDEASRLKTRFLSNMSHELRTPLNSVIALTGVLARKLEGKIPEEEFGYLDVIDRNGRNLLALINDILDLSRIESGKEDFQIRDFNPIDLVREIVELLKAQADQKGIELSIEEPAAALSIQGDYAKSRHILQNLISNAVKFTDVGSVRVKIDSDSAFVCFCVEDSGIGIDPKHIPFIFDEFRQVDDSSSRKKGGTGLGLAIAQKYATSLGASISVESEPGKGSIFTLSMPKKFLGTSSLPAEIENSYPENSSPESLGFNTKDRTVLVVEDSDAIVVQMRDMLETEGYSVAVARNGEEALASIKRQIPSAIILDLMMPKVDGFEVLKQVRAQKNTESLPVTILTAKYVSKEELSFLKHNGIYQLIQKGGIDREGLLRVVAQMMVQEKLKATTSPNLNNRPVGRIEDKPLLLVVEDNPDNMLTMRALLGSTYSILEANDGLSGVEMAKKHHPDLILMDIALPGMNGIEALAEIRACVGLERIPCIAVTASAMRGEKESILASGFNAYLSKPVDAGILETTIQGLLS